MRIALLQTEGTPGSVAGNLERLRQAADAASAAGARLLICPEMFATGYNIGGPAIRALAEPADGDMSRRAAAIAREAGLALLYGYPELAPDGAVFNAALLLDRDGSRLANHRKSHLFGAAERAAFRPGCGAPALATLGGMRVGVLICYEAEFPETVRTLALAGADLVAVPTALMLPYTFIATGLMPARACENQVYLAYANRCGSEHRLAYAGLSGVTGPDGADLARAAEQECLLIAELSPPALAASRRLYTYLDDRRPAEYAALSMPLPAPSSRDAQRCP